MFVNNKDISTIDLSKYQSKYEAIQALFKDGMITAVSSLVINRSQIEQQIDKYVKDFQEICQQCGSNHFAVISIMRGAKPLTVAFVKRVSEIIPDLKLSIVQVRCSSYGSETESSGKVDIEFLDPINPQDILRGKIPTIILEDIIEEGNTIKALYQELNKFNIDLHKIYFLVDKSKGKEINLGIAVDRGIKYDGKLFLYGFGPDFDHSLRDLEEIWGISAEDFNRITLLLKGCFKT